MKSFLEKEKLFWDNKFDEEDHITSLPYHSASKNMTETSHIKALHSSLPSHLAQRITTIANGYPVGIFLVLLSGVKLVLHKYTGEQSIVIGVPTISSSNDASLVNQLLILKNKVSHQYTYESFLSQIKLSVNEALEHQSIPFWHFINKLQIRTDEKGTPIIDTIVSLQQLHHFDVHEQARWSIMFRFDLVDDAINLSILYNHNCYNEAYISQLMNHLFHVFSIVLFQPQLKIEEVGLVSEEQKAQILLEFNNTEKPVVQDKTIHQLFEEQVVQTPHHIAIVFEDEQLTYIQLNERANQLARTLKAVGVQADQLVAIMTERSIDMIVGILAILKAGGAYVPIDPAYPAARIRYILEDSNAQVVVMQRHLCERVAESFTETVVLLEDDASYAADRSNLTTESIPDHLGYVLYTSGTTGQPKGVMIDHKSAVNTVSWYYNQYIKTVNPQVLLTAEYTFDPSIEQIFATLLYGATLHGIKKENLLQPSYVAQYVREHQINLLDTTPLLMQQLLIGRERIDCLKLVICGGERLEDRLKDMILQLGYTLYNHYGPTETTVDALVSRCEADVKVTLGKPIANAKAYILDERQQLQPIGIIGELYISGKGVARGYINRPEWTAEKFVANPFVPGERMYRTGDLARWMPNGDVEFIGRLDDQVKIRGYRIEIGEVEVCMLSLASVKETIVMAREDHNGDKYLVAYYVTEKQADRLSAAELRTALANELPAYMVPSFFIRLEQIPLTSNGKMDRKALPVPDTDTIDTGVEYVAPRTLTEQMVVELFQEVLGLTNVGVKDNFFDIGGSSMKAIKLISIIQTRFKSKVPLGVVYEAPTVEALAQELALWSTRPT